MLYCIFAVPTNDLVCMKHFKADATPYRVLQSSVYLLWRLPYAPLTVSAGKILLSLCNMASPSNKSHLAKIKWSFYISNLGVWFMTDFYSGIGQKNSVTNWTALFEIPNFCFLWLITLFTCYQTPASEMAFLLRVIFKSRHPSKSNHLFYKTSNYFPRKEIVGEGQLCNCRPQNIFSYWGEGGHNRWGLALELSPMFVQLNRQIALKISFFVFYFLLSKLTTKINNKINHYI